MRSLINLRPGKGLLVALGVLPFVALFAAYLVRQTRGWPLTHTINCCLP